LEGIISEYLNAGSRITAYRNQFKQAVNHAFYPAFENGYEEGGGSLPLDDNAATWILNRAEQEFDFVDGLFTHLRDDIKKGKGESAFDAEIAARAEGYAKTLDGVRSQGMAQGSRDVMVCLGGNDGQESCPQCQALKGKWLKLSEVIARGLLIQPGNTNYECKNFFCQHYWYDHNGKVYTT
jgi:hypothetical protein